MEIIIITTKSNMREKKTELEVFNKSFHERHRKHLKEIGDLDKEFEEIKLLRHKKKSKKK